MSKINKNKGGIIAVAVVIAATGAYLYSRSWFGKELTPVEAARIVPEEAWMATYISTDSQTWSKLEKFGTPEAQELIGEKLEDLSAELSSENINYQQDIQPWLGGVMLAALPAERGTPSLLMVIGIKNKLESLKFFSRFKDQKRQETQYKGFTIIETKTKNNRPFNAVFLDSKLIIAPKRKTVELAIDTFKGNSSFADKQGAKKILKSNSQQQNSLVQIYLPAYSSLLQQALAVSNNTQIPAETLERLNDVESMMMGVKVHDLGLQFQAIAQLNPKANLPKYKPVPGQILSRFPTSTIALFSGGGISQSWSWLVSEAEEDPTLTSLIDKARGTFQSSMNLDLDKDVFSWMDGEFGLAVIPSNRGVFARMGLGGMAIWKTSDRSTAQNTIKKIEQMAKSSSITVRQKDIQGKKVTEWQGFPRKVVLTYSWLDNKSLLMTFGTTADKAINTKAGNSLAENKNFNQITSSLPNKNLGYFYVNFEEVMSLVDRLSQRQGNPIPSEPRALLNSIEGIALTVTQPNQSISQLDMTLSLKSSNNN